jgi:hypothetical protein
MIFKNGHFFYVQKLFIGESSHKKSASQHDAVKKVLPKTTLTAYFFCVKNSAFFSVLKI